MQHQQDPIVDLGRDGQMAEALEPEGAGPSAGGHPSVTDMYTIGIGPSSSHTVGPMRAGRRFREEVAAGLPVAAVRVDLFGSLALTGRGHATDRAVILGLAGERPSLIDPDQVDAILGDIADNGLPWGGERLPFAMENVRFNEDRFLDRHPNAMTVTALDGAGETLVAETYYSIGGGFVLSDAEWSAPPGRDPRNARPPFVFNSADELIALCEAEGLTIAEIMWRNEAVLRDAGETGEFLRAVRDAMHGAIERGFSSTGTLPGGLKVRRRACGIREEIRDRVREGVPDPLIVMDWVNLYALAVNEENAAGGRVVTAPTNGAAGVIPAVMRYHERFCGDRTGALTADFLMTAAAIGILYKKRASISAAEMGCQGEVGVACSMAAAALAAALGGNVRQVTNAAEIGMEHNLGLTCDPVAGLVQVPCIERNCMGAVKAINAARLALMGDGRHVVSLDNVIDTMRQTGRDMAVKYKETSQGGLAVNVVAC